MSQLRTYLFALVATAIAAPAAADEVNVYSYRQPHLIKPLTDAFTQETGIKVNVAFLKKGMVERLKAEGDRSPADLVFTVDISRLGAVVNAGVTQSVSSETLNANVPAQYRDPDGHWWGLTTRARIVYAAKGRVKPGEVSTYMDLADPKWKGRICTRSGLHAYNVALTSAMLHHYGPEKTKAWLTALKGNLARKPQGNDRAQIKAIWARECDLAIGNTYYLGKMMADASQKDFAKAVYIQFPVIGGKGAHVNISGVAMTKHAPNRDNALKMMEFLTSPKAQEIYATANYEYPIAPGSKPADLVASWGSFTPDSVNLMDLAKLRPQALQLIEQVDFDG